MLDNASALPLCRVCCANICYAEVPASVSLLSKYLVVDCPDKARARIIARNVSLKRAISCQHANLDPDIVTGRTGLHRQLCGTQEALPIVVSSGTKGRV